MSKIKVMSVFGTRPEAIKMCPLVKKIENDDRFESIVCVTGQHKEMLYSVLDVFKVKPDFDLEIMTHGQTIIDISNKVLCGIDNVIREVNPDIVLVHGDTSTTMNAAMAAFYNKVPVGHVEAGLRSFDMYSPFPEEMNRKVTGALSTIHFSPTNKNRSNLLAEGISGDKIHVTGNTVIDALLSVVDNELVFKQDILNSIDYNKKVILLTTHRRENWGQPMKNIFKAVRKIVDENNEVEVIFPMHKNPYIRELAYEFFKDVSNRVHLIEPLEYVEFTNLMSKVYLIMTDSGGIQEEAPALSKPVIVLRTETERPEAVEAGTIKLAGIKFGDIYRITKEVLDNTDEYEKMSKSSNPYGDGKACMRIVDKLFEMFNESVKGI